MVGTREQISDDGDLGERQAFSWSAGGLSFICRRGRPPPARRRMLERVLVECRHSDNQRIPATSTCDLSRKCTPPDLKVPHKTQPLNLPFNAKHMMALFTDYFLLPSMNVTASSSSGITIKASIAFNDETFFYAHFLSLHCIVLWVIAICFLIVVEVASKEEEEEEEDKEEDEEQTLELGEDEDEEDSMLAPNAAAAGGGAGKQNTSEREEVLLQGSARAMEWAVTQKKKKKSQQQGGGGQESRCQKSLQEVIIFGAKAMKRADIHSIFLNPVTDTIAPGYSIIVKEPMSIRTIEEKAVKMEYTSLCEFERDVRLMFDNCIKYNNSKEGKWFQNEAKKQKKAWEHEIMTKVRDLQYKKGYW